MLLREATAADAHSIATIHVQAWQAAYQGIVPIAYLESLSIEKREALWRGLLMKNDSETLVAESQGEMRGWINMGPSRDDDAGSQTGEIWALYVSPGHWGTGVGQSLLAKAAVRLPQMGFSETTLWVLRDNKRAIRFYHAADFRVDFGKEQIVDCGGAKLVEIRLRRQLSG